MSVSQITRVLIQNKRVGRHILNNIKTIPIGETQFENMEINDRTNYYRLNIDHNNIGVQGQFDGFGIRDNEVKYTITIEDNLIRVNVQCNKKILEDCIYLSCALFVLNEGLSLTAIKKKDSHLLTKGA